MVYEDQIRSDQISGSKTTITAEQKELGVTAKELLIIKKKQKNPTPFSRVVVHQTNLKWQRG